MRLIYLSPGDGWTRRERLIFIGHTIVKVQRDLKWTHRERTIVEIFITGRLLDDWIEKDHEPRLMCDRGSIVAQSWPDHGAIVAHLMRNQDHDHLALMPHDYRGIVANNRPFYRIKQPAFLTKFLFKKPMYSLVFLNS